MTFAIHACAGNSGDTTASTTVAPDETVVTLAAASDRCTDATGDSPSVDLTAVTLSSYPGHATVRWQTADWLPSEPVLLSVMAGGYQLGARVAGRDVVEVFAFEFDTARNHPLPPDSVDLDTWTTTLTVPADVLDGWAPTGAWSGSASVAGTDVDTCESRLA